MALSRHVMRINRIAYVYISKSNSEKRLDPLRAKKTFIRMKMEYKLI